MYGLKQAAQQWYKKVSRALERRGFKKLSADKNVFIKGDFLTGITVILYVDDTKIICIDMQRIHALKNNISSEFKIIDMGPISYYLDMKITYNHKQRTLKLSQADYIKKILELLKIDKGCAAVISGIPDRYYEAAIIKASIEKAHQYLHIISNMIYRMVQI